MSILGNIMSAIFGTKAQAGELPTGAGSDVAAILDKMAADNPEKLDWKNSIVDLMKLLKLNSSIGARKQLAKDLNYTGNTGNSAAMNIWLHQQVMQKLAANGGKVPAESPKYQRESGLNQKAASRKGSAPCSSSRPINLS